MAKSKRKSGGCTRGRFKMKKMGKGWAAHRRVTVPAKPIDRVAEDAAKAAESAAEKAEKQAS